VVAALGHWGDDQIASPEHEKPDGNKSKLLLAMIVETLLLKALDRLSMRLMLEAIQKLA
jgi:hypothetical protein